MTAFSKKNMTRLSKFLSLVLRHKPEAIGIELGDGGWTDVDVLLDAMNKHGRELSKDMLVKIVKDDEKQRYSFNDDTQSQIRANQGHSVPIDLKLAVADPPDELYHGTATRHLDAIFAGGLSKMKRHHVHMSPDVETATKVGRRHGKPIVLTIDAKQMQADGYEFFVSDNEVWLTDHVEPKYLRIS